MVDITHLLVCDHIICECVILDRAVIAPTIEPRAPALPPNRRAFPAYITLVLQLTRGWFLVWNIHANITCPRQHQRPPPRDVTPPSVEQNAASAKKSKFACGPEKGLPQP